LLDVHGKRVRGAQPAGVTSKACDHPGVGDVVSSIGGARSFVRLQRMAGIAPSSCVVFLRAAAFRRFRVATPGQ